MEKTIKIPPLLVKVGKERHLRKLQDNGEIYFGTFSGYRAQEKKELAEIRDILLNDRAIDPNETGSYRGDSLEGLEQRFSGALTIAAIGGERKDLNIKIPDAKLNIFQNRYRHLYCLYALPSIINSEFKIDQKMLKFGETALVITKPEDFIKRICTALKSSFDIDFVKYYDPKDESKESFSVFEKQSTFAYQNEFRIAANLKEDKPICIGDIKDISKLVDASELMNIKYKVQE